MGPPYLVARRRVDEDHSPVHLHDEDRPKSEFIKQALRELADEDESLFSRPDLIPQLQEFGVEIVEISRLFTK